MFVRLEKEKILYTTVSSENQHSFYIDRSVREMLDIQELSAKAKNHTLIVRYKITNESAFWNQYIDSIIELAKEQQIQTPVFTLVCPRYFPAIFDLENVSALKSKAVRIASENVSKDRPLIMSKVSQDKLLLVITNPYQAVYFSVYYFSREEVPNMLPPLGTCYKNGFLLPSSAEDLEIELVK